MTVPKYIRKKMHDVALYAYKSGLAMTEVEMWLESRGLDTSAEGALRDGIGYSLEELEYGRDITDELCERIERILQKGGR